MSLIDYIEAEKETKRHLARTEATRKEKADSDREGRPFDPERVEAAVEAVRKAQYPRPRPHPAFDSGWD